MRLLLEPSGSTVCYRTDISCSRLGVPTDSDVVLSGTLIVPVCEMCTVYNFLSSPTKDKED